MKSPFATQSRRGFLSASVLTLVTSANAQSTLTPNASQSTASPTPHRGNQQAAEIIDSEWVESFALVPEGYQGEPWQIHLAKPRTKSLLTGNPVIYMLDGNASFPLAWHALAALRTSKPELAEQLDRLALVGIGYPSKLRIDTPRRYRDFTPYTAEEFRKSRGIDLETGGQQTFLQFIANDVRKTIVDRLNLSAPAETLFGHSLGGMFTLHALYNRPELFENYVAADPSFWWNGSSLAQEQKAFIAGVGAAGGKLIRPKRVLVENAGKAHDSAEPGQIQTPAQALARIENLGLWHRRFEEESHGSMLRPALTDTLLFALGIEPAGTNKITQAS